MSETDPIAINRTLYLGAPAEEVWEWLVEPERTREYSLSYLVKRPRAIGDPIQYVARLTNSVVIAGVVEQIVETRSLIHTFQYQFEDPDEPSRVTYELLRYGEGMCCLQVRHEGLIRDSHTFSGLDTSWDVLLSSLKTIIETGKPLPWPRRKVGPAEE